MDRLKDRSALWMAKRAMRTDARNPKQAFAMAHGARFHGECMRTDSHSPAGLAQRLQAAEHHARTAAERGKRRRMDETRFALLALAHARRVAPPTPRRTPLALPPGA